MGGGYSGSLLKPHGLICDAGPTDERSIEVVQALTLREYVTHPQHILHYLFADQIAQYAWDRTVLKQVCEEDNSLAIPRL